MEFVQFHPTAVATAGRAFLVSEAVRGEGAYLVSEAGDRFMVDEHPDAELAPRDVVTRAIQARLDAGQTSYCRSATSTPTASAAASRTWSRAAPGSGIDLCAIRSRWRPRRTT